MNPDITTDILVCGAGPAGFAAAASASRCGAKVLLVERYGFPGGAAAAGLVNPFMVSSSNGEMLVKGVFEEITDELKARGACADGELFGQPHIVFDPEALKFILLEGLEKSQVKLLLHSTVVGAMVKGDELKGVVVSGKSGDIRIFAKAVIDATGDGDIAYLSGSAFEKGRKGDGGMQPATLMFRIAGVDIKAMPSRDEINKLYSAAKSKGSIRTPRENFLWFETTREGEIHVNSTRVPKVDGTDVHDLTKAEIEGRKQVENLFSFLKKGVTGFENSYISYVAPQVGIRETRRITGEYVLTGDDVLAGKKFDDPVAKCNYPIDIHSPDGKSTTFRQLGPAVYYEVPYRCMVPVKTENLLVTGRAVSADHEALSSLRVMPTCMAMGQAAGVAAAIAVKKNIKLRKVPYEDLRKVLNEQGADMRQ